MALYFTLAVIIFHLFPFWEAVHFQIGEMGVKEFKYGGTKTRKRTDETEKCEFYFLCIPVCAFFKYSFPLFIELFFGPLFSSGRACLRTLIFISLFRHCMLSVERHINQSGGHFVKVNRQAVCQSSRKGGNL